MPDLLKERQHLTRMRLQQERKVRGRVAAKASSRRDVRHSSSQTDPCNVMIVHQERGDTGTKNSEEVRDSEAALGRYGEGMGGVEVDDNIFPDRSSRATIDVSCAQEQEGARGRNEEREEWNALSNKSSKSWW